MNQLPVSLYEITGEMATILTEEDWTEETTQRLDALGLALEVKAKNVACFCANLEAFTAAAKAEEDRIAARRKAAENRLSRLKEYVKNCMESAEIAAIDAGTHKLRIQNNPPKLVVENEEEIPAKFFVVIPETKQLDKKQLLSEIKNGESVPGCRIESGTHLRIR